MQNFELGRVMATQGALAELESIGQDSRQFALTLLLRHSSGDWGEVSEHDARMNELGLEEGERLISAYTLPVTGVKVWIITESDRSHTTILLPDEY